MSVTIDVVAAVKEALQDVEIRDQIRQIVQGLLPHPAEEPEHLLDARDAAKVLGMTPGALRMAVQRGTIPCERIGRRLRFRPSKLRGR